MSLDAHSKIQLLNDEKIELYKKLLSSDDKFIFKKNGLVINGKNIVPPRIIYVNDRLKQLKSDKCKLLIQYHDLYNTIVMIPIDKVSKTMQDKYGKLVDNINSIEQEIEELQSYNGLLHDMTKLESDKLNEKYMNLLREQNMLTNEFGDINRYLTLHENVKILQERINEQDKKPSINFYIDELPKLSNVVLKSLESLPENKPAIEIENKPEMEPVIESKKSKKESKKETKPKKEIKKKEVSPKQLEIIKDNVKKLLGSKFLKPQSKEECVSQKRSQAYYMSLKSILEEIEKHPELKAILPKNYKTLPKEKLCEYLYAS